MKIKLSIFICFFLLVSPVYASITVKLTNLSTENIQLFIMPNAVTFGPLGAGGSVTLTDDLNARLANQSGPVVVFSRFGYLSCGTVFFFSGANGLNSVTHITIQAIATDYISCVINPT